jgi:hypothetical protein
MVEAPAVKRPGGGGAGMPAKLSMLDFCFFGRVCICRPSLSSTQHYLTYLPAANRHLTPPSGDGHHARAILSFAIRAG